MIASSQNCFLMYSLALLRWAWKSSPALAGAASSTASVSTAALMAAPVGEADLAPLRAHGFSDEAITIAVQVIGYFNYINRIADGLGVEPEAWLDAAGRRLDGEGPG